MNISLTTELETWVQAKVASGLYTSASEVVREALRMLYERDQIRELRLGELRHEVQRDLEQLDRGALAPLDLEAVKTKARRSRTQD